MALPANFHQGRTSPLESNMNHRNWTIAIVTGVAALGLSMQANAHDPKQFDRMAPPEAAASTEHKMDKFSDLDKNSDGYLTAAELSAEHMLHRHFAAADSNGDKKLSEAEVSKHHAAMMNAKK
jgi:hypothetical protein